MNYKPEETEYAEFYKHYVALAAREETFDCLNGQIALLNYAVGDLEESIGRYRYADGKWSIKELLGHIIDAERVFAYRILRIARGDKTPLSGFDQDPYIEVSNAADRTFADLLEEFDLVRRSNIKLIGSLDEPALLRTGTASDNPVSVRALVSILIGHSQHHLNILNERYLADL